MLVHICGMTKDLVKPLADNNFSMLSVDSIDMIQASKDASYSIINHRLREFKRIKADCMNSRNYLGGYLL